MWQVLLLSQLWFGYEAASSFLHDIKLIQKLFISFPLGILLSTLIFFISSSIIGQHFLHILIHVAFLLAFSVVSTVMRFSKMRLRVEKPSNGLISIIISFFLFHFIFSSFYLNQSRLINSVCNILYSVFILRIRFFYHKMEFNKQKSRISHFFHLTHRISKQNY